MSLFTQPSPGSGLSVWVVTFSHPEHEPITIKVTGYNDVIAAHIPLPILPQAAYYGITLHTKFDTNAFRWVWSYVSGLPIEGIPIATVETFRNASRCLFELCGTTHDDWLLTTTITPVDYPLMMLVKQFLSSLVVTDDIKASPEIDVHNYVYVRDIVDIMHKKGYLSSILPLGTSRHDKILSQIDKAFLSLYMTPVVPISLMKHHYGVFHRVAVLGGDGRGYSCITPIRGNIHYIETISTNQVTVNNANRILEVIALVVSGVVDERLIRFIMSGQAMYITNEDRTVIIVTTVQTRAPGETYVIDNITDNARTGVVHRVPWVYFLGPGGGVYGERTITPIPPIPLSIIPSMGIPIATVGGRKCPLYPLICISRSGYMKGFFSLADPRELVLFPDDPWNPAMEYAWNYINGLDNRVIVSDNGSILRIFHYLNYFNVSLTTALFDNYLIDLCSKVTELNRDVFPKYIRQIGKEERKSLSIFYPPELAAPSAADAAIFRLSGTVVLPLLTILPPGAMTVIYNMRGRYGNRPSPHLVFPLIVSSVGLNRLGSPMDDIIYKSVDMINRVPGRHEDGVKLQTRRGEYEMYEHADVISM